MSNLQLPDMGYWSLNQLTAKRGTEWTKIAYATWARRDDYSNHVVLLRHHKTTIASVSADKLIMNNRGFVTSTTTARLHALLLAFTADHILRQGVAMRTTGPRNMRRQDNWVIGMNSVGDLSYMLTGEVIFNHDAAKVSA